MQDADRLVAVAVRSGLPKLSGYPFEVRYSNGARARAQAMADLAANACAYFSRLFAAVEPDIAVIVANETDWPGKLPYGLPFFRDGAGEIRPGIVVMPAGGGEFWIELARDLRVASPREYTKLRAAYPDGAGGLDLQPFFDLITIHELGHAFEVLGNLRLRTFWLSEIFVNLAMHAFVATRLPASLPTLEVLPVAGARSRKLSERMRSEGYSTLDELQAHYTGSDDSMHPLNYVWFQYRWLRLVAKMFDADGEQGLVRLWNFFHATDRFSAIDASAVSLAPLLATEVSPILGRAVRDWR